MSFGKSGYKDKNTEEYKLAHSFLKELGVNEDIEEIKRQENHIDVLILTESYAVILEDKTFSKEHSEQLKRYNEICKSKYFDKKVKLLYFKTGYMDIQEKEKFENNVGVLEEQNKRIFFEYAPEFLRLNIPFSSFMLPLKQQVYEDEKYTFDGLFGVFNDSLSIRISS